MHNSKAYWRRYAFHWKWHSEECKNLYHMESELKTKFSARWNNNVDWAAPKDLSRMYSSRLVNYLLFKVTQKVSSFPSMSIFTSVGNYFVQTHEMLEHKKGALYYHQDDWNFHKMVHYMLRLDYSVKDDKEFDALLGT